MTTAADRTCARCGKVLRDPSWWLDGEWVCAWCMTDGGPGRQEEPRVRLPVRLVVQDWQRDGESIYDTPEGIELSLGPCHSGTVIPAEVTVPAEVAAYLRDGWARGAVLVVALERAGEEE